MSNSTKSAQGPLHTTIREPDKFQIQLVDTDSFVSVVCARCSQKITLIEDHEHVILWPNSSVYPPYHFHVICYGEVVAGMVEFFKVFIVENRKQRKVQ